MPPGLNPSNGLQQDNFNQLHSSKICPAPPPPPFIFFQEGTHTVMTFKTNNFVGLMPEKGIYGFPTIILLVSIGKTFQLFGAGNESCDLAGNESSAARLKSIMGKYAVTNGVEENT